jgi:hypothetical protein
MSRSRLVIKASALAVAAFVVGCSDPTDAPRAGPVVTGASSARAASTSSVSVSGTIPSDGFQTMTLDVTVNGSGFDQGATATFPLNGVVDPRVHVNSTRYVKSSQLVANVTIAADAPTVKYDVAVLNGSGKKGIGSELFTVNVPPPADPAIAYEYVTRNSKGVFLTYGLGVMNADGTNQTMIAASSAQALHPAWSPDGHSIAYQATNYGISRVDVSVVNGVPQASAPVALPISHLAFDIAWSPDPSNPQIAYSESPVNLGDAVGVYLAPATPVSPYVETHVYQGPPNNRMIWIAWNPQGTRIALIQRSTSSGVDSLFVIDVGTKSATFVRSFPGYAVGLSWSRTAPDRLALAAPLPNNSGFQASILDLTTNTLSNAPSGLSAKWSPDDSHLVYIANTTSAVGPIYVVNLSTGAQVKLTTDGMQPEWRRNP